VKDALQAVFGEFHGNVVYVLLDATQWTVYLSLAAFLGGGLIGLLVTVLRIAPNAMLKRVSNAYIWLFQAVPLLMLLFLIGLGVPVFFGIDVPPWLAAGVSLTLFTSAFMADVWRGSLESIAKGQWEALMRWGKKIANAQLDGAEPFVIYPIVALIYFCLCFPLSLLSRHLERSMLAERGMANLDKSLRPTGA